jgi:hypothetical protein
MLRKIFYKGDSIVEHSLVVGSHGNALINVDGNFAISGLIYCPKQALKIKIKGTGTIALHGVVKELEVRVDGNCSLDFRGLKIANLRCRALYGTSTLKVDKVSLITERNIGDQSRLIESSDSAGRHSEQGLYKVSLMPAEEFGVLSL